NEGAEDEGNDNEGINNEGVDNEGAENEGTDNEGTDNEDVNNENVENKAIKDFVERCYEISFQRTPDEEGAKFWEDQLVNGKMCASVVVYNFMFGKEYTDQKTSDDQFVKDAYAMFMGREPEEEGYNFWINYLWEGASRRDVFTSFANSDEFYKLSQNAGLTAGFFTNSYDHNKINRINLFVERFYKTCLGRIGDKEGQTYWTKGLLNGSLNGSDCAANFIKSTEYKSFNKVKDEFVEDMYETFMGREGEDAGFAYWTGELKKGLQRDKVFEGFVNSNEFLEICNDYGISRGKYRSIFSLKKGDHVKLGRIEQDSEKEGLEPIEWEVLAEEDGKLLLLSKYAFHNMEFYHNNWDEVTWENSDVRKWLNGEFYETSFTDEERELIPLVKLDNNEAPIDEKMVVNKTNDTEDHVFCLSVSEVNKYFNLKKAEETIEVSDYQKGYIELMKRPDKSGTLNREVLHYKFNYYYDSNLVCSNVNWGMTDMQAEIVNLDFWESPYFDPNKWALSFKEDTAYYAPYKPYIISTELLYFINRLDTAMDLVGTPTCRWWLRTTGKCYYDDVCQEERYTQRMLSLYKKFVRTPELSEEDNNKCIGETSINSPSCAFYVDLTGDIPVTLPKDAYRSWFRVWIRPAMYINLIGDDYEP
ncbi:MAG: DUF4214 domain-containing protein, partial [Lachnospiraceae bacterium]|nr:DUF4214 domain-containing protein [Lachnospiraceae bacterium]